MRLWAEATKLYNDAKALLAQLVREKWLKARGVIGFWPANSDGKDTVVVKTGGSGRAGRYGSGAAGDVHLEFLRQQIKKAADQPNISLSDFIAPAETGKGDHIGAFVVTMEGIEPHLKRFEAAMTTTIRSCCRL
jgi:5-methyltetrahydrofolate--homocysteine methyltransferase